MNKISYSKNLNLFHILKRVFFRFFILNYSHLNIPNEHPFINILCNNITKD